MSLEVGFGVGFRGVVGGSLPVGNEGKGEGGGESGGWGGDRQKNRQVNARTFAKTTFRNLPFSLSPSTQNTAIKWQQIGTDSKNWSSGKTPRLEVPSRC